MNLSSGKDDGVDIPLHISCRLKEGKIVLNSLQDGKWGKEERHGCPFKRGEEFDLRIRAHDQEFEVVLSSSTGDSLLKLFCYFLQRFSPAEKNLGVSACNFN